MKHHRQFTPRFARQIAAVVRHFGGAPLIPAATGVDTHRAAGEEASFNFEVYLASISQPPAAEDWHTVQVRRGLAFGAGADNTDDAYAGDPTAEPPIESSIERIVVPLDLDDPYCVWLAVYRDGYGGVSRVTVEHGEWNENRWFNFPTYGTVYQYCDHVRVLLAKCWASSGDSAASPILRIEQQWRGDINISLVAWKNNQVYQHTPDPSTPQADDWLHFRVGEYDFTTTSNNTSGEFVWIKYSVTENGDYSVWPTSSEYGNGSEMPEQPLGNSTTGAPPDFIYARIATITTGSDDEDDDNFRRFIIDAIPGNHEVFSDLVNVTTAPAVGQIPHRVLWVLRE